MFSRTQTTQYNQTTDSDLRAENKRLLRVIAELNDTVKKKQQIIDSLLLLQQQLQPQLQPQPQRVSSKPEQRAVSQPMKGIRRHTSDETSDEEDSGDECQKRYSHRDGPRDRNYPKGSKAHKGSKGQRDGGKGPGRHHYRDDDRDGRPSFEGRIYPGEDSHPHHQSHHSRKKKGGEGFRDERQKSHSGPRDGGRDERRKCYRGVPVEGPRDEPHRPRHGGHKGNQGGKGHKGQGNGGGGAARGGPARADESKGGKRRNRRRGGNGQRSGDY